MKDFMSMVNPVGTVLRNAADRAWWCGRRSSAASCARAISSQAGLRARLLLASSPRKSWRGAEGKLDAPAKPRGPDQPAAPVRRAGRARLRAGRRRSIRARRWTPNRAGAVQALGARFIAVYPFGARPVSTTGIATAGGR